MSSLAPSGTSQSFAAQLMKSHECLSKTEFYLGRNTVLQKVGWVHEGRVDRLVIKQETGNDEQTEDRKPEMVTLTAIVCVDRNDFWMTSDGGYVRPSIVWKELAKVKLTCTVCSPDLQPAKGAYKQVILNLQSLQCEILTPGYQMGKGFFLGGKGDRFKLRHVLFEVSSGSH